MLSRQKLIRDVSKQISVDVQTVMIVLAAYDENVQNGILNGEIVHLGTLGKVRLKHLSNQTKLRIHATNSFKNRIKNNRKQSDLNDFIKKQY